MKPEQITRRNLDAVLYFEDGWFVARCLALNVSGRGQSDKEAIQELLKSVAKGLALTESDASQLRCHSFSQLFSIEVPVTGNLADALSSMPDVGNDADFSRHAS